MDLSQNITAKNHLNLYNYMFLQVNSKGVQQDRIQGLQYLTELDKY